ncbi:hypothetical protein LPB19_12085 [Marinobacter salinisoli]|uniref:Uncharacterized protein n=1 Tax=Marinobacter salinisoli TaxID=2769486 RepID=A0ABX7MNT6_9GAMM|nr:hypothetical protein [Marinobacter salinisoli]QSP93931.1 hypothetical protein LPB19_12085 [Marinobacter salinisoli]
MFEPFAAIIAAAKVRSSAPLAVTGCLAVSGHHPADADHGVEGLKKDTPLR